MASFRAHFSRFVELQKDSEKGRSPATSNGQSQAKTNFLYKLQATTWSPHCPNHKAALGQTESSPAGPQVFGTCFLYVTYSNCFFWGCLGQIHCLTSPTLLRWGRQGELNLDNSERFLKPKDSAFGWFCSSDSSDDSMTCEKSGIFRVRVGCFLGRATHRRGKLFGSRLFLGDVCCLGLANKACVFAYC